MSLLLLKYCFCVVFTTLNISPFQKDTLHFKRLSLSFYTYCRGAFTVTKSNSMCRMCVRVFNTVKKETF